MALSRRANALDALGGNKDGRGVTRRDIVDDVLKIEDGVGSGAFVTEARLGSWITRAHPFIRLAGVVQPQVVVNGLGREHHWKALGQRLQSVQGAVAAHANQTFHPQLFQPREDQVQLLFVVRINVVARRTDERAALGRVQFRNFLIERVEMNVRNRRVKQAVESLDQAEDFDAKLVGANDRAVNGRVQGRCVSASS